MSTYFSSSIGVDVALNQCDLRTVSYKEASTLPFLRSSSKIQSEIHAEDGQFSESSSYGGRTTKVLGRHSVPAPEAPEIIARDAARRDSSIRRSVPESFFLRRRRKVPGGVPLASAHRASCVAMYLAGLEVDCATRDSHSSTLSNTDRDHNRSVQGSFFLRGGAYEEWQQAGSKCRAMQMWCLFGL